MWRPCNIATGQTGRKIVSRPTWQPHRPHQMHIATSRFYRYGHMRIHGADPDIAPLHIWRSTLKECGERLGQMQVELIGGFVTRTSVVSLRRSTTMQCYAGCAAKRQAADRINNEQVCLTPMLDASSSLTETDASRFQVARVYAVAMSRCLSSRAW